MHHKNHKNSTSNHNAPQHQKNPYPSAPAPQSQPKRSALSRFKERFQEKPATKEEVAQLGLNAKREVYKTQIQRAKSARPGRFDNLMGGGGGGYRQSSSRRGINNQGNSWLLGPPSSGGGFLSNDSGPSFSFITGQEPPRGRGKRQPESGFGKGIADLF